jgi:hypothetical protein
MGIACVEPGWHECPGREPKWKPRRLPFRRQRPQRGLPHGNGPLGGAFLIPRPLAVVGYFNSEWAQSSPTSRRIVRNETGSDPGGQHCAQYRILGLSGPRKQGLTLRERSGHPKHGIAAGQAGFRPACGLTQMRPLESPRCPTPASPCATPPPTRRQQLHS